jgi:uncharacterized protein (DUF488 family)
MTRASPAPLFTVGHSTRPLEEFLGILEAHGVALVADVRRFPGSRRHPQFAQEALRAALADHGVDYLWMPALGGRRARARGAPPSPWRVVAFAAYADHMTTPDYRAAAEALADEARRRPTAVLCAEAFPYSCHRRLVSDWAELHGIPVEHLLSAARRDRHRVTPFARRRGDLVVYEEGAQLPLLPDGR